ncbi:hypothetical protein D3C78_1817500 [compost metagenome]
MLNGAERQVEFCHLMLVLLIHPQLYIFQQQLVLLGILQHEHHIEQRIARHIARQLKRLD